MTRSLLCPLLFLAPVLASCASYTHSFGLSVPEGRTATVRVLGDHPQVRVANSGPGAVRIQLEAGEGLRQEATALAGGIIEWSLRGPLVLALDGLGPGAASVRVETKRATGLAAEFRDEGASVPAD